MDQNSIELENTGLAPSRPSGITEQETISLPPVDGGKAAWLFLAGAFTVEALVWGFPFAFGVFQEYYSSHEPFAGSPNVAVIGTCAMGIMYLACPLTFAMMQWWPITQRPALGAGLITMCLALSMSSFSTTVGHLILTQGVLYAIGGSLVYCPTVIYVDQWFVKRKGFAFGIMWAGTGLAGFILPLVMEWLLHDYGYKTTLRVWAVALFVLTAPLLYFVRPRLPLNRTSAPRRFDLSFLTSKTFNILQAGNIIESLGYFLPTIYLPMYARSMGASSLMSALTVILFNVASVFGCVAMGSMVDRFHVTTCIMVSTIGSTIGVFVFWGLSASLPLLYTFCVIYGLFAGSYTSAWPGITRYVQKEKAGIETSMVFAWLAAGRGIGNVVSGPLSEALLKGEPWRGEAALGYGSGYGGLIVFTGITAALGGLSFITRRVGWL
ncbi:hypothetical protein W97_05204 [Coniosporium apollinis CBS 100218]|uniref:Major facilitator superfamily (MFS) profile domain-containing protein n=3 Tax=Coniosporium TaxID=2810619 RepID=R7YVN6_CONA1|nr:uncharacterized protein W97_05204 [Coniosporium apollinis CBS 100218]EON65962.1 hypothetical protein W97_05204 [Coniosporium apollinis CBS 100218]